MQRDDERLLGAQVRDLVTGLEGIAIAVTQYLNGCVRVCVQPPSQENKVADSVEWCDIQQVQRIGAGVRYELGLSHETPNAVRPERPTAMTGGPQKDAPRS